MNFPSAHGHTTFPSQNGATAHMFSMARRRSVSETYDWLSADAILLAIVSLSLIRRPVIADCPRLTVLEILPRLSQYCPLVHQVDNQNLLACHHASAASISSEAAIVNAVDSRGLASSLPKGSQTLTRRGWGVAQSKTT